MYTVHHDHMLIDFACHHIKNISFYLSKYEKMFSKGFNSKFCLGHYSAIQILLHREETHSKTERQLHHAALAESLRL